MHIYLSFLALLGLITFSADLAFAQEDSKAIALPEEKLRSYLSSIPTNKPAEAPKEYDSFRTSKVPEDSIFFSTTTSRGFINQPLNATRELLILINPEASAEAVKAEIEKYSLKILRAVPEIGLLLIDASASQGTDTIESKILNNATEISDDDMIRTL